MEVSDDDKIPERLPKFNFYSYCVKNRSLSRRSNRLLPQQKEALEKLCQWFDPVSKNKDKIALVSMPTGSGKTGIISCLPYFLGSIGLTKNESNTAVGHPDYPFKQPVLVIAPNLAISKQLEEQLSVLQSGSIDQPFLIRRKIVPQNMHKEVLPTAIRIERTDQLKSQYALEKFDMIIANAQKFSASKANAQTLPDSKECEDATWEELPDNMFQLVMVDEAHHHPAHTWRKIVQKFKGQAQIVFFTATPYRGDLKKVLEDTPLAFHLPLNKAVADGIIRQTKFEQLEHNDDLKNIRIRNHDGYEKKQIHNMGRMVTVLRRVKDLLVSKNRDHQLPGGVQHMAMAIAKNVDYANQLLELWNVISPNDAAETYYHDKKEKEKKDIMLRLKNNELRLVIVVQMLLEGFDHPPISIAAITCKISSPVKFAQFVGRAQRIYRGPEGTREMNGQADIITHVDYKQRQRYVDLINETLIPDDPPKDQ